MTIEAKKIELAKQLLPIEDEHLLEVVKWILDRPSKINVVLASSIKRGIEQAKKGQGIPHKAAREVYKKWL